MNIKRMKELINHGECLTIEYKELINDLSSSIFVSVVSFLNTIGGYCILGVSDTKQIVGVNEEQAQEIKLKFANEINNPQKINPPMPLMLQEIYIDNKLILYVYVPESSEVHKLNNKYIYERTDEGDRNITDNTYAVKRLYLRKSGKRTEDFVYNEVQLSDFDENTLSKARKLTIIKDSRNNWELLTNEEILKQKFFYKKDSNTGEYGFTLASILLFGKTNTIQSILPWYKVDIIKRIKDEERYDDRFICEDNLINSFDKIINYINNNLDSPFFLNKKGETINVINIIVRELVSNILIHREFMDKSNTKITIYNDKIVVENPNLPKLFSQIDVNNYEPYSKNIVIAKIFRMIGYADELGSGFKIINNVCKKYFNTNPEFIDKSTFISVVDFNYPNNISINKENKKQLIIEYIQKNGKITNAICREICILEKSQATTLLRKLVDNGDIFKHGSGPGTYYDLNKD